MSCNDIAPLLLSRFRPSGADLGRAGRLNYYGSDTRRQFECNRSSGRKHYGVGDGHAHIQHGLERHPLEHHVEPMRGYSQQHIKWYTHGDIHDNRTVDGRHLQRLVHCILKLNMHWNGEQCLHVDELDHCLRQCDRSNVRVGRSQ